jgi:hypothetical protein
MTAPILLVHYRFDVVGETRRVVHIVPLADPGTIPEVLATYCGERIPLRVTGPSMVETVRGYVASGRPE